MQALLIQKPVLHVRRFQLMPLPQGQDVSLTVIRGILNRAIHVMLVQSRIIPAGHRGVIGCVILDILNHRMDHRVTHVQSLPTPNGQQSAIINVQAVTMKMLQRQQYLLHCQHHMEIIISIKPEVVHRHHIPAIPMVIFLLVNGK